MFFPCLQLFIVKDRITMETGIAILGIFTILYFGIVFLAKKGGKR